MSGAFVTLRLDTTEAEAELRRFYEVAESFARKKIPVDIRGAGGPPPGGSAPAVQAEDRAVERAGRKGGMLRAFARRFTVRRMVSRGLRSAAAFRTLSAGTEVLGGGMEFAGGALARTPVGMLAVIGLAAGVAGFRLASGQPLEGAGEMLNRVILGDEDDKARAARRTREWLEGTPGAGIVGRAGAVPEDVRQVARVTNQLLVERERGASLIRENFPVNSKLDMLILAFGAGFKTAWAQLGGGQSIESLKRAYHGYLKEYNRDGG
ncbi:MAG TPA: hypothetical protein VNM34_15065 [Verrucomicrobiae bacterium]|nr:hypothetical protein [Verrucomicrobiae bacterium]